MFAFVVLPVMDTYMRRGASGGGEAVVAQFDGITLTQARMDSLTRNHAATVRFLRELAELTIADGGVPRTGGFSYDAQNQRIERIGINETASNEWTVRAVQWSNRAKKAGFELDDFAIETWLQQYSDGRFTESQIIGLLMESTGNSMGRPHLYEQLRYQLLASMYSQAAYAAVPSGQFPQLTPSEQWESFLKLNRNARIDVYGVPVSEFMDQTNENPSMAEIQKIFDEGKDRSASDQSPEPGFYKRSTAKFEYLVANYKTFLDAEIAKLTEEELRAEYDKRLSGGEFQLPTGMFSPAGEGAAEAGADAGAAETSPEAADSGDAAAGKTDAEASESAAGDTDAASAEEAEGSSKEAGADASAEAAEATAEETAEEAGESTSEEGEAGQADQSSTNADRAVRLVALQDESQSTEEAAAEATEEAPASEESAETAESADEDGEGEAADDSNAESEGTEGSAGEDASAEAAGEEAEPAKTKTFEEVRDQIAEDLAGPEARRKLNAAAAAAVREMKSYFNSRAIHESNVANGDKVDPLEPFDMKALAKKLGLEYQEPVGPYDIVSIDDEPIAQSSEEGFEMLRRGPPFALMMYGFPGQLQPQQLYYPLRTVDDQGGLTYISWKTEEKEAYTPTLDEVKDEVIKAARTIEARDLALAAAQEIAEKVDGGSFEEAIGEDKKDFLDLGIGPFSHLQMQGRGGSTIGNVPELDSVGDDFMKSVFATEIGGVAVAMNQPKTVVYVIKPVGFEPSFEELQTRFKQPTDRMMAAFFGGNDGDAIVQGFYESVDDRSKFQTALDESGN